MAFDPRGFLTVGVGPRVIENANLKVMDAYVRGFGLEQGNQLLHIAIGPGIITVPLDHDRACESQLKQFLPFFGCAGQHSVLVDPLAFTNPGGK